MFGIMVGAVARLHVLQVNRLAFERWLSLVRSVTRKLDAASRMLGGDAFYQGHSGSAV